MYKTRLANVANKCSKKVKAKKICEAIVEIVEYNVHV